MKKIEAILKGLVEDIKVNNKVKRVELALQTSELNFKSTKDDAEIELNEALEKFNTSNVNEVITEISEIMDKIELAETGLKKIEAIKELLYKEVEE